MIKVFIPHRWKSGDYEEISALLDRTKFEVIDHSVPIDHPLDNIDGRYKLDPKIKNKIKYASVVVCSNRPANNNGMSIEEIRFAINIRKPVVAIRITDNTSTEISELGIEVIPKRKDSLEACISRHTNHH